MTALIRLAALSFVFSLGGSAASAANEPAGSPLLELRPNAQPPAIARSLLLGLTRAGSRVVAVGEQGLIELSDDDGKTFRAPKSVPVQVTLTAVHFADASHGGPSATSASSSPPRTAAKPGPSRGRTSARISRCSRSSFWTASAGSRSACGRCC